MRTQEEFNSFAELFEAVADRWDDSAMFICLELALQAHWPADDCISMPAVQYLADLGMPLGGSGFFEDIDFELFSGDSEAFLREGQALRHERRWLWLEVAAMLAREGFQP